MKSGEIKGLNLRMTDFQRLDHSVMDQGISLPSHCWSHNLVPSGHSSVTVTAQDCGGAGTDTISCAPSLSPHEIVCERSG